MQLAWPELHGKTWRLTDLLSGATYDRNGSEMLASGLFVALDPLNFHLFRGRSVESAQSLARAVGS